VRYTKAALSNQENERLRLDYGQTTGLLRDLNDVRFKLLAFVPTVSGAAVGLLSRNPDTAMLIGVGAIGLAATLGIVLYELANAQLYDYAAGRARELGLPAPKHQRGLAFVYGAAIGGWSYLLAWGALHSWSVDDAQRIGGIVGVVAAVGVFFAFLRLE
jgi:hypothetical protein